MSDLTSLVIEAFSDSLGGYPESELEFMCHTVAATRPDLICEWGTGSGCSGRIFWECQRLLGLSSSIHTVELPDVLRGFDNQHPGIYCGMYLTDEVFQHRGDGVTEALIVYHHTAPKRPLFFLDGDHSEVMVYREIALIERVAPESVMLIHDTNSGPGEAGRKWATQGRYQWSEITGRTGIGSLTPCSES